MAQNSGEMKSKLLTMKKILFTVLTIFFWTIFSIAQQQPIRLIVRGDDMGYGKDVVYSGPVFQSLGKEGNKIVLSFTNTGGGLMAKDKYGYLKSFAIAGADQKFTWAKAWIEGNKVIVFNENIPHPMAVRYARADNPDGANLYNKEGLPASPFRSDTWKGVTEK
jgi:sialate O-acetylesterase